MSAERDAYVEKLKSQLDEWNTELNRLEGEARKAKAEGRNPFESRIEALRQKEKAVKETLGRILEARDDAWDDLKKGMGSAWSSLKTSLTKAKSEFERGLKEGMEE